MVSDCFNIKTTVKKSKIYLISFFVFLFYWLFSPLIIPTSLTGLLNFALIILLLVLTIVVIFDLGMSLFTKRKFRYDPFHKFYLSLFIPVFIIFTDPLPMGSYLKSFDSEHWKNSDTFADTPTTRRMMLGSLTFFNLKGKTMGDVAELLGADENLYFKKKNRLAYVIGQEDGLFQIDFQWLVIDFDDNSLYSGYSIMED